MPRTSTIERHKKRKQIEQAIVDGTPTRDIAKRFGVSSAAVHRHKDKLPEKLVKAEEARLELNASSIYQQIKDRHEDLARLLQKAEEAQQYTAAIQAARACMQTYEMLLKVAGELQEQQQVNIAIVQHPEYADLIRAIRAALTDYPEAQAALAAELGDIDN